MEEKYLWKVENGALIDLPSNAIFQKKLLEQKFAGRFKLTFLNRKNPLAAPFFAYFNENVNYVGLCGSSEIRNSDAAIGRYVVATEDINFNTKIVQSDAYVAVIDTTSLQYCLTCLGETKTGTTIRCRSANCKVRYCSIQCKNSNTTHRYECQTAYHTLVFGNEIMMKLAIQMVFRALATFGDDIDRLRAAVEEIIGINCNNNSVNNNNNNNNAMPATVTDDDRSKFNCIMSLQANEYPEFERNWFEAFSIIMQLPEIQNLFRSHDDKIFLQHLLAHNLRVGCINCFETELIKDVRMCRLYHTVSFFNHSCSPNVLLFLEGQKVYGIASRKIAIGEHLCIDYKGFSKYITTQNRQKILHDAWNFQCECARCAAGVEITKASIENATNLSVDELERRLGAASGNWTPELGAQIIAYQRKLENLFFLET